MPQPHSGDRSQPIIAFDAPNGDRHDLVGGKGANLGRLTKAGFPVPAGSTVTTEAYREFIAANALTGLVAGHLAEIDYGLADTVEAQAAAIRAAIIAAPMPPEMAAAISAAYAALGDNLFVAVRSSGTAEDLEAASFAGQHDTYLDIRGVDAVLDAVKRCWASLWTARAVAYRQQKGFVHDQVGIAIVIQTMIESEISGVMFTANPMTTAVDEYVVNASYGLGEAIVSGIVTPDLFILNRGDRTVRRATLGSKTVKIVRDPAKSHGVIEQHVAKDDQDLPCLTDKQLSELGALGGQVAAYYGDYPQDIEWGFASGKFYLLQSRDITGVEFSWDEDLDNFQNVAKDDNQIWTRSWSDAVWTGQITPLFYSARAENAQWIRQTTEEFWGLPGYGDKRIFKYHKAFVYYGSEVDYRALSTILHPKFRTGELMEHLPPDLKEKIKTEPFSWMTVAKMVARIAAQDSRYLPWNHFKYMFQQFEDPEAIADADGLPADRIRLLSDDRLKRYCVERNFKEGKWVRKVWTSHYLSTPIILGLFTQIVENWAGEADPQFAADLLTGCPEPTITEIANEKLIELVQILKAEPKLLAAFEAGPAGFFFATAAEIPEGAVFTRKYAEFMKVHGHRGQADRDISFDRRRDNPQLDYTALRSLMDADPEEAAAKIEAVIAHRERLTQQVVDKLKRMPFGDLRAQAFVTLQAWLLKFWQFRDDQRAHVDRATYSQKLAFAELGRRLHERGILEGADDYFMFSQHELYAMLDRRSTTRLDRAKLVARKRNYDRFRVEFNPPKYMIGDVYADLEAAAGDVPANQLKGVGMSRGSVTGTARVIASLSDIGRVQKGDILITVATDPGWTPVFVALSGLVLETGGMLAHGACISREYGIPAVQAAGCMTKIKDGDTITVNGDLGLVTIEGLEDESAAQA